MLPSHVGRLSYRDACIVMGHMADNPPMHVLAAMRWGFYEERKKQRDMIDIGEARAAKALFQGKPARTFDNLPPVIQERVMQRKREAEAKQNGRR